jgi:4-hydroxy-4-methyl-2-oxoglutarate aldolase
MRGHIRLFVIALAGAGILPLLAADIAADPKLRANRNTYSPVIEVLKDKRGSVTEAQLEQLKNLPLEAIWGAARQLGYNNYHAGLKSTRPDERLVGRALTIRYLPRRPDLEEAMKTLAAEGDWPVGYHVRAAEEVKPGDVLVVDLGGGIPDGIFFGDISALAAKVQGAHGVILYGSSRDLIELQAMEGFPVLAVGFDPMPATQIGVDWNVPIRVGGATVLPGDVVVADAEASLFFPASIVGEVIERATRTAEQEEFERELVREKKHRFRDVYPPSPELRKRFEEERKRK